MPRLQLIRFARAAAVAAVVICAAPGAAIANYEIAADALPVPVLASPGDGASVEALPAFAWEPAVGVDRYDFQIAADAGFTAPVLGTGDLFRTRNTRATLKKTIPNGTYWWRVRSVTATGDVSAWSSPSSFELNWATPPTLLAPAADEDVLYPSPLVFRWTAVPGARSYVVSVARDPAFASLVRKDETDATSFAYPALLTPGTTYYWGVTPLDAGDHPGAPSAVRSFRWLWPSQMGVMPPVRDVAAEDEEIFDPGFSWGAVPGAARYEVEMWSSDQPDLKVCCTGTSIGTSLIPTAGLNDNTYFWRVRALDPSGEAGQWNEGPSFTKNFGDAPITGLRMRDNLADPGTDVAPGTPGYQTRVPIIRWDPYPGASSYDVEVTPFESGLCNWTATSSHWKSVTATTAWTPIGTGGKGEPYNDPNRSVVQDAAPLFVGQSYCVRIRPRDDASAGPDVYGDYTYFGEGPAFQFVGYPDGEPCADCSDGYLPASSYELPARGETTTQMPLFTWRPRAGYQSYFILVAKDPSFHTIVDYAFTQLPAYAPRTGSAATTYQDETTHYYWAVLPAVEPDGDLASGDPLAAHAADFKKESIPPTLEAPSDGAHPTGPPTFEWTPAAGAQRYRLEVSQDESFTTLLEAIYTNATGYTSNTTYPSGATIYWRVRGEDARLHAMTWSETATLERTLPAPIPSPTNPGSGAFVPSMTWGWLQGAVAYDLEVVQPNGVPQPSFGRRPAGFTPSSVLGIGAWTWRVRGRFPTPFGQVPGPYTEFFSFARSLEAPSGANTDAGPRHALFSWEPDHGPGNGIKEYRLQISAAEDFATTPVQDDRTQNTSYAPDFTRSGYVPGRTLYWRVAAVDGANTTGDYTTGQAFTVPATAAPAPPPPAPPPPAPPPPTPPPPSPPPASPPPPSPTPPAPAPAPPAPPPVSPPPPPPPAAQPSPSPSVPSAARCIVPSLRGKTLRAAKRLLVRARCRLGTVRWQRSARVPGGRVINQRPRAGTRLRVGAKISVTLSRR
ncbi:MAG TPA: PASTA domain-containing protein [Gaiellaceae bacterium]|nr:PASTA domain-containing protein [Gaiellaceae bacterium]